MKKSWYFGKAGVLFLADEIMKTYAEQNLDTGEEKELTDRIVLRNVLNRGMCLGILSGRADLVKAASAGSAAAVTALYTGAVLSEKNFWVKEGLTLMAAGAWSNTFDRFVRGHVVDYIGFKGTENKLAKLTCNLGDLLLAAGALLYIAASLLTGGRKKERRKKKSGRNRRSQSAGCRGN